MFFSNSRFSMGDTPKKNGAFLVSLLLCKLLKLLPLPYLFGALQKGPRRKSRGPKSRFLSG